MQDRAPKRFSVISTEQELYNQKTETQRRPLRKAPTPPSRASTSQIRLYGIFASMLARSASIASVSSAPYFLVVVYSSTFR